MRKNTIQSITMAASVLPDQPPAPRFMVFIDDRCLGHLDEMKGGTIALPPGNWTNLRLVPVRS